MKNILLLILMLLKLSGFATTYYVSNAGSDTNNGTTTGTAWQTLAKVNAATFAPGDQILFNRGDSFYGSITVKNSGTSGSPITFGAYGTGANPIITGFTTVTAWTNLGNNIWESTNAVSTLSNCNMVTVNGINTAMGRFPNEDAVNSGYMVYQSHTNSNSITSSSLTGSPNWTGAEVAIRVNHFVLHRSMITSQTSGTLIFANNATDGLSDGFGFFIQNDPRTLDQQNEWYYNSSTKKIQIYSSSQPVNVQVATINRLITINANYLNFNNLTFTGANEIAFYNWDNTPRWNHINITNSSFLYMGISAIYMLTNYLDVENNTILESNCSAIATTLGTHVTIMNNSINNICQHIGMRTKSYSGTDSAIQSTVTTKFVAKSNNITNVGFNVFSFYGDSILIQNNYINTFCNRLDDGGGIYTFTGTRTEMHDVKIDGNVVLNGVGAANGSSTGLPICSGIYLDLNSSNVEISNNSVSEMSTYGIFICTLKNVNVHNNTVYDSKKYQYYSVYWGGSTPPIDNKLKNNIFVCKTKDGPWDSDDQKCIAFYFVNALGNSSDNPTPILNSTSLDSNYYARPIADDKVIRLNMDIWNDGFKTLAEWQSFSGQDAHSHKSPVAITSENDLRFEYNATTAPKTVSLSYPMIDVKGNKYASSVTLSPYASVVLMVDPSPTSTIKAATLPNGRVPLKNGQYLKLK